MASKLYKTPFSGGSISRDTLYAITTGAAHADDYVFQELLKLARNAGGAPDRVILPFQQRNLGSNGGGLVQVGVASTPVQILPFRAIIGPRTSSTATPPTAPSPLDPLLTTAGELSVRDIRSAVFAGPAALGAPGTGIPSTLFAPNISGNPRYDLVYAALYVDYLDTAKQIITKPPASGTAGPQTGSEFYVCSIGNPPMALTGTRPAFGVVTGTLSATAPIAPTIPPDVPASGIYYFPLALVVIPGTFTPGTTTFSSRTIIITAPIAEIGEALGGKMTGPVSAISGAEVAALVNLPGAGSAADNWAGASRPSFAAPVTMKGGIQKFLLLDAQAAAASAPLGDTAVLDDSLDWRNRYFRVTAQAIAGAGRYFASDPLASGGIYTPGAVSVTFGTVMMMTCGQSFRDDTVAQLFGGGGSSRNGGTLALMNNASMSVITASGAAAIGLYVDLTTGKLLLYYNGTPGVRLLIWIDGTGAYDNF